MRLDKFLKISRLIKRRTLAKEICNQQRIQINGKPAKAGSPVKVGDELSIQFGSKLVKVKVDRIAEQTRKDEADSLYTILEEVPIQKNESEEEDNPWG
ncbi:MAG: RNA-binding S4 domain-containing protein [Bacillaceae bacterium]|nr:RNA-binding S4 domain-containing protein [Bacillaceae bacterium]